MNLCFDRTLIGAAMYFFLMGEGQPWGRYDDMLAGWASKRIADHLGYGVKTGTPNVWHSKRSDPFVNLKKEFLGIEWQETLVPWFENVPLSADNVEDCYLELADRVEEELTQLLDPKYWTTVAQAMRKWIALWRQFNRHNEGSKCDCSTCMIRDRELSSGKTRTSRSLG